MQKLGFEAISRRRYTSCLHVDLNVVGRSHLTSTSFGLLTLLYQPVAFRYSARLFLHLLVLHCDGTEYNKNAEVMSLR